MLEEYSRGWNQNSWSVGCKGQVGEQVKQRRQAWAAASLRRGVRRVVKAERSGLPPVPGRSLNRRRGGCPGVNI